MEIKILIYEDSQEDLENLLKRINNFFSRTEIKYDVHTCTDSKYIIEHHFKYDLIFLDVEVFEENGIEIGCKIRRESPNVKIVITTHYSKYLQDGYKAQANRYFCKPIQQEDFDLEMKDVIFDYLEEYEGFYDEYISHNKIYFKEILYVEFLKRKTDVHFISGEIITTNYSLKYWIHKLSDCNFAQPYKSLLVNLKHISGFVESNVILINEECLPVSRFFKKTFEENYMTCLRRKI